MEVRVYDDEVVLWARVKGRMVRSAMLEHVSECTISVL